MKHSTLLPQAVRRITESIISAGGRPVLVGGAVRDYLIKLDPKDFDIEVYGLKASELIIALERVAKVYAVGKSFGVLKVSIDGMDIDVSLPRSEKKAGTGHRGFIIDYDHTMSFSDAAKRRDFTINAMGIDLRTGDILDPWGGLIDLDSGCIRHVSDSFDEDPLRPLRACQFAARFGFAIAEETLVKCRSLQVEMPDLSKERIWEEIKKLLLKSQNPSVGIKAMESTGVLILFPELERLRGVFHNPISHPEGDVWTHNNLVSDSCAAICRKLKLNDDEALVLLLSALCHDLGKPETAILVDGVWKNPEHEKAGVVPSQTLLTRLGCPINLIQRVIPLVREHGQPLHLWRQNQIQPVADGIIRRLALRVPIQTLCQLALADFRGRITPEAGGACPMVEWLLDRAASLGVLYNKPMPILLGRHLQDMGVKPGPHMGQILNDAFQAQLDGDFSTLAGAIAWIQSHSFIKST